MRGLAFPSNAVFDRETSYDYGTPTTKVDDIPIDPALSGPAIEPAIVEGGNGMDDPPVQHAPFPQQFIPLSRQYSQEPRQYSQGPQGDPFAPLPPPAHLPIEEEPRPIPKPLKRKRKPRREEECGFCQGNDSKNKDGQSEVMATCEECGRSGHPSCMELGEVGEVIRSYPWKCIECKTCEICQEKGDDERILFCDFCDRGWHMDCIQPPIKESPPGRWYCPLCPQLGPDGIYYDPTQPETLPKEHDPPRASSVASSSRSKAYPTKITGNLKGKGKAVPTDDPDSDEQEPETPTVVRTRGRPKSNKKIKVPKETEDERQLSPVRPTKRKRVRVNSPVLPRIRLRLSGKGKEREEEEKGLFDDILSAGDRDTSRTTIEFGDKQRFERSRLSAEEKLAPPPPVPPPSIPEVPVTPGPSGRPLRSSHLPLIPTPTPGLSASPPPATPGPSSQPHGLRIRTIRFGQFDIQTWYDAPFPEEYANIPDGRMWICEFCLKYMKSRFGVVRHRMKCKARHPPGDEIYRDGAVSIFEVDGRKNKIYCQNLCLLSKMFLDHKSLFYDVEPFLFYVMAEVDDVGARFVGYFSKEKRSPKDYNVSCIMTLPVRQRQGWGNLLIDFSYLLSKKEKRLGSPEKPLSGLGALGYKNYWALTIMRFLKAAPDHPRLEDITVATSMTIEDVYTTLSQQNMIFLRSVISPPVRPSPGQSIKFPKGRKNGIARKHLHRTQTQDEENSKTPFVLPKEYDIHWDREKVEEYLNTWEAKGYLKLKPEKLKWSPFLLARMKKTAAETNTPESATRTSEENTQEPVAMVPVNGKSTSNHDAAHSLFVENGTPLEALNAVTPPINNAHVEEPIEPGAQAPVPEVQMLDVKSEDPGTPLTSLTSRQSAPSDDTICLVDTNNVYVQARGAGKETSGEGAQDAEPAVQTGLSESVVPIGTNIHIQTLGARREADDGTGGAPRDAEPVAQIVFLEPVLPVVAGAAEISVGASEEDADAEYEEDIDADGEYEEDAEVELVNLTLIH